MMTILRFVSTKAFVAAVLIGVTGCKKQNAAASDSRLASLLFDTSSPAAREALATQVDFRITETNYAQWEQAQRFLDALPRSAFVSEAASGGDAIDRAVATLEASPRARTAIERTGLTVRDFVLETIALAQAAEAGSGKPPGGVDVPPENVQFVQRYQSRIMQARAYSRATRARVDTYNEADTMAIGVQSNSDVAPQVDQGADVRTTDTATTRTRATDSSARDAQPQDRAKPPPDSARDTVPR